MHIHQPPFISLIMATIENQNMVPKGWAYKLFMIADPLQEVLGPTSDESQNFEDVDVDGEYSRSLKEDLTGRIEFEAIFI